LFSVNMARKTEMLGPYAHTTTGPETEWELLDDHLEAVAVRAECLAGKFGAGPLGRAMGLLHDLGKAKDRFQQRLRNPKIVEPHAAEGALAAVNSYARKLPKPFEAPLGRLLAFAIAGHHSGMANGIVPSSGIRALQERLTSKDTATIEPRGGLPSLDGSLSAIASAARDLFAWAFFTRMLFSALVDADRLATEEWQNKSEGKTNERGWTGSLADLKSALDEHLAEFDAKNDGSELARLRAEVLADCRAAGALPRGLFSLTVPTGGGKTLSSLAFALDHAVKHKLDRIIYVIPFTSIIDQTADVFRKALGDGNAILEHHSAFDDEKVMSLLEKEDDGAAKRLRLAAQNWDRPIVVTTAVQFFESLFSNSPGKCRKLHNIARSVVVLDEAQTLPIQLLRPSIAALKELTRGYGTSVVLCTATQPAVTQEAFKAAGTSKPPKEMIAQADLREIVAPDRGLYARLQRVKGEVRPAPMSDADLVAALSSTEQSLVIVNNRRHARELFDAAMTTGVEGCCHLTTAMTAAHRQCVLAGIRERLQLGQPVRLVSTSLIEAGVDVSFKAVWRARAGLDQIVQAAGRCNRNGELGPLGGKLTIFTPEEVEGRGVPHELKKNAEATDDVLRRGFDPLSPEAVREYFSELLYRRDDGGHWRLLDDVEVGEGDLAWHGIMDTVAKSAPGLNFRFADIARAYRLIAETMVPVIIPASINPIAGVEDAVLRSIGHAPIGGALRELQRHIVQIPRRDRDELLRAGSAACIAEGQYAEQFVELTNKDLYDAVSGFDWSDPFRRSVDIL
jgi:CRISPR-associated endonuclease/helicase Cas3